MVVGRDVRGICVQSELVAFNVVYRIVYSID